MAEQLKAFRLAGLEEWRTRAFGFGGPLGHLFTRTFEVVHTVVRDGIDNEHSLPFALESLGRERDHAMQRDTLRDEAIRALIYGLADSVKTMIDSIRESGAGGGGGGGGGRAQPVDALMDAARAQLGGAIPDAQHFETVREPTGEESTSSSSETLPLFSSAVKREYLEHGLTANLRSSFDHDDFALASRPPAYQPISAFNIKRSLSEEPTTSQPLAAFKRPLTATTAHSGEQPVLLHCCEVCDRYFESERGLMRHSFTHSAPRCTICNKCVSTEKMQKHIKEKHGGYRRRTVGGSKYGMDDSDDEEEAKRIRIRKERAATAAPAEGAEPDATGGFPCSGCDRSFATFWGLRRHEYMHNGVPCPFCARTLTKEGLATHIKEKHRGRGG